MTTANHDGPGPLAPDGPGPLPPAAALLEGRPLRRARPAEAPRPTRRRPLVLLAASPLSHLATAPLEGLVVENAHGAPLPGGGDLVDGDGIPCSLCGIPQHGDCWAFAGRCATYACEGRPSP